MPKRRTKGDGGITHRKDGRWQATLDVNVDGRVKRKTLYGRTQAEARHKLALALRQREDGTLVMSSTTVAAWLDYWYEKIAAPDLKPQSRVAYESKVRIYLKPFLGHHRLGSLRPEHVRGLYDWMRDEGKSEGTIRTTHAILKRSLRDAINDGKLVTSPVDRVKPPKGAPNTRASLTLAQANLVLKTAGEDPRWWLALFYGMRQGEVLGLRWGDVDFENDTLTIAQSIQNTGSELVAGVPKSGSSARTIPLLGQIKTRLLLAAPPDPDSTDLIFGRDDGTPTPAWMDWKAWRRLLDATTTPPLALLPYVSLHSARQSAASLMEAAGIPDRVVMQILGHSQVRMTHHYQKAALDQMRDGLERAVKMLG